VAAQRTLPAKQITLNMALAVDSISFDAVRVALNLVANMQRLEMTARFFIQRLEQSGISEQRRQPVSNSARLRLGFSPLSKTIVLAKMRDLGDGTKRRVGNDRGRDVTNEAAQLVWHLVMAEGGEINWELDDGSRMVLKAEKQEATSERD
jgi:hypothetical protein